eukprot:CAMPEP_0173419294 /NCGR_PEP_ID=MMETSP1357-20121228/1198_1 /TAXON_ID=77926 /ORGANISM="Hemiselmis rufescens, Strain PCC563" /LENGTH=218 /DNA_ID=CAMNT_0014381919 /DNA_START=1 /DNA_END=657 /DNA_ORIENTATION=-
MRLSLLLVSIASASAFSPPASPFTHSAALRTHPDPRSVTPQPSLRSRSLSSPARPRASLSPRMLFAGVDPGTPLPNDAFYFGGVALAVVGAFLLQAQTYQGSDGLGYFLSTGPEDKNWEKKQAKASEQRREQMNEEGKGSFFANLLPKLDFVEVYGQDKEVKPKGREELERLLESEGVGKQDALNAMADLQKQLAKAVDDEDMEKAAKLQARIKEMDV